MRRPASTARTRGGLPKKRTQTRRDAASGSLDKLVAELSGAFVRAPLEQIDQEINHWLRQIVSALGLDRSTIAEFDPSDNSAVITHGWAPEGHELVSQSIDANSLLPWTKAKMLAGETVVMSSPDHLPKAAAIDRETFHRYGPKSNVMVPIRVAGTVVAAMGFGALYRERTWSRQNVRKLEHVAEIFGYAFERKRAAVETAKLRAELTRAARIAPMGELTASVAHEMNQPLAAILQNAEAIQSLLATHDPDLGEVRAAIGDMIEDAARASDVIKRLRSLFRGEELKKTELELGHLVGEVAKIVRSDALTRNVSFALDLAPAAAIVLGDRVQLQQAVLNLVLNAFEAVAGAGHGSRQVVVKVPVSERSAQILVRDSGGGIDAEALPRIFDPFFTTKPDGMGMGLAISRSIVESHGGRLTASPNPDRGMTFGIDLPIYSSSN